MYKQLIIMTKLSTWHVLTLCSRLGLGELSRGEKGVSLGKTWSTSGHVTYFRRFEKN